MTVNVDEQNYSMKQRYNLALAIWSLVEADLLADDDVSVLPVNTFGDRRRDPAN